MDERKESVKSVLLAALELPPEQRDAFAVARSPDERFLKEVRALLGVKPDSTHLRTGVAAGALGLTPPPGSPVGLRGVAVESPGTRRKRRVRAVALVGAAVLVLGAGAVGARSYLRERAAATRAAAVVSLFSSESLGDPEADRADAPPAALLARAWPRVEERLRGEPEALAQARALMEPAPAGSDALERWRALLSTLERRPDALPPDMARSLLGAALVEAGRLEEAEETYARVLTERCMRLPGSDPGVLAARANVAVVLARRADRAALAGEDAAATALREKALAVVGAVLDVRRPGGASEPPAVVMATADAAGLLLALGRPAEAEPLYAAAVAGMTRALDPRSPPRRHPRTVLALVGHGAALRGLGRLDEAMARLQEAWRGAAAPGGLAAGDPERVRLLVRLGDTAGRLGRDAEARAWLAQAAAESGAAGGAHVGGKAPGGDALPALIDELRRLDSVPEPARP
jgi:tetratricopeptide (TPR) repeat protein